MASPLRTISMLEVSKHNTPADCWVVFHGKVYDLSSFHAEHPGGSKIITSNAGKDVTALFEPIHPKDIAERLLGPSVCVGVVDPHTVDPAIHVVAADPSHSKEAAKSRGSVASSSGEKPHAPAREWKKPPLEAMLNHFDFESVAAHTMTEEGWGYYSSGADDEITLRENHNAFQRIWLKPRVLVNVKNVSTCTSLLGYDSSFPLYFTATALGKLAHEEGELAITRAAHASNVIYMLPTLASYTLEEMLAERGPGQVQFGQLYVNADRERSREYIEKLERGNVKALFITVDAPQLGRREKDMRNKFTKNTSVQKEDATDLNREEGVAKAISGFIDPSLCWDDLTWFKSITNMPIVLKGVACDLDATMAYKAGCRGVVLSNHGGRQLDTARSGIEILPEVVAALTKTDPMWRQSGFEVYIDGGIRRGSDIFKAIALGATAVGIGRPVLYSLASYGQPGIERMVQLLKDELIMVMRLMGCQSLQDISPSHVLAHSLSVHVPAQAPDHLALGTYEPMKPAAAKM